jgi:hypothetical protein
MGQRNQKRKVVWMTGTFIESQSGKSPIQTTLNHRA